MDGENVPVISLIRAARRSSADRSVIPEPEPEIVYCSINFASFAKWRPFLGRRLLRVDITL